MFNKDKLEITGVLLTGGASRRMGKNKAFLQLEGQPLLQRSLDVLQSVCREVLISSRGSEIYEGYGFKVVPDVIKDKGPLGGLYSVLPEAKYEQLFIAACDMPLLQAKAIKAVCRELGDYDAVVPYISGRMHPLHGSYHRRILPLVERNLQSGKLKLMDLLNSCRSRILNFDEAFPEGEDKEWLESSFWNVNTPDDWERIKNADSIQKYFRLNIE